MNYSLEERDFYTQVKNEFQLEYPDIKLEFISIKNTAYKKLLPELFKQNTAPDIFTYHSRYNQVLSMSELLSEGWISPIGNATDLSKWMSRWPKESFVEGINMHEGWIYGFPLTDNKIRGTGFLYCNTKVLTQAGFKDGYVPDTWDEFLQTCKSIKEKAGLYPIVIPMKSSFDIKNTWDAIAGSIKTDQLFDYTKGRFDIDDPELIKAFEFIKTLYRQGLVLPGLYNSTQARKEFGTGNSAFIFDGSWLLNVLKLTMGFDLKNIGIVKPPYPRNRPKGALAIRNTENKIWISSQSKHLKEARIFIDWMTRPDGFYALEYLKRGLGVLAYNNFEKFNGELPTVIIQLLKASQGLKRRYPEPLEKCSDLSESRAFQMAETYHPNWEWDIMYHSIFQNEDFLSLALKVAKKKNEIFRKQLKLEKAQGLNVSITCYQFPDWNAK